jgi:cell division protein FtsB
VKTLALVLLILLFWLQYKIWLQDGGIPELLQLSAEVDVVKANIKQLQERNQSLDAEVQDLKKGLDAIEERARSELGMVKQGEIYYQVIEPDRIAHDRAETGSVDKKQLRIHQGK